MSKSVLICLSALVAGVNAAGESVCKHQGVEIELLSIERTKTFRDLAVKNESKHDLVIVRVKAKWNAQATRLLVKDSDLKLTDARGKSRRCSLRFIQAYAPQDLSPSTIEIPFQVNAGVALKTLQIGSSILDLSSAPEASASSKAPPASPTPPL
ncbi:MAG: hypothetical protein JXO72_11180 [Vicinamibacteria bacterium]|nr:hypothetical protein [Vicinamibacteria bacterium]